MRVLHLYSGNLYGGIERMLATLAACRHLAPEMEPAFALCFRGRLWDELTAAGVPVYDLGAVRVSRPWTVLGARNRLAGLLRDGRFDVVACHANWPHAVFAPTVRAAGVRLVTWAHDAIERPGWIDRWARRTPPDLVVANSRHTAGTVARVFPGAPVEVVYLPVPEPAVGDKTAVRKAVRADLETPDNTVVVLQASRLERWKGQAVHVSALGRLRDVPGWEAWFAGGAQKAGEAAFLSELRQAADDLGVADRVKFLGQRSDVARLMAAADVYCQPNTGPEPFGVAFVEALHAGLPVVTSDVGGGAEVVNERCGILAPPGDTDAVAAALRLLVTDPVTRLGLGLAGPVRAWELCDPARQLAAIQDLLAPSWAAR